MVEGIDIESRNAETKLPPAIAPATSNRSSAFTACWSELIYAVPNFGPYRSLGAYTFNRTASRLVVVMVFDK
jgi:hypothetical protein